VVKASTSGGCSTLLGRMMVGTPKQDCATQRHGALLELLIQYSGMNLFCMHESCYILYVYSSAIHNIQRPEPAYDARHPAEDAVRNMRVGGCWVCLLCCLKGARSALPGILVLHLPLHCPMLAGTTGSCACTSTTGVGPCLSAAVAAAAFARSVFQLWLRTCHCWSATLWAPSS
jgi:hypothetical protein